MWGDQDNFSTDHQAGASRRSQPVHAAGLKFRLACSKVSSQEAPIPSPAGQDGVRGETRTLLGRRGTNYCTGLLGATDQISSIQKSRVILGSLQKSIFLLKNLLNEDRIYNNDESLDEDGDQCSAFFFIQPCGPTAAYIKD